MTLTYKLEADKVKMNGHARYLGQISFRSIELSCEQRVTRTADRLQYCHIPVNLCTCMSRF